MGHLELFFEAVWEARLRQAALNQDQQQAQDLLTELRQWSESHKFTDPDRAVRLHLTAVILFSRNAAGEAEAQRHLELPRSYTPHDEELKKQLDALTKTLQTSDQLSSGTGFIIDARGYILTNHHVIEGPGGTVVRLPGGGNDRVPAQGVAQDAKRDIALLKVDPQRFVLFEAMPITTGKVSRAASVAVFGFPLGDEIGNDVRITTGVVSALPEQSDDGMLLLDCRVNPGNSGLKAGGRFPPHRTHQNGLSVDIFMPVRDAESRHTVMPTAPWNKFGYSLEFDRNGRGEGLAIDFDSVAELLLEIHRQAGLQGLAVERFIVAPEYVDRVLSAKAVGFRDLGPLFMRKAAWVRHDEHLHIDFRVLPARKPR